MLDFLFSFHLDSRFCVGTGACSLSGNQQLLTSQHLSVGGRCFLLIKADLISTYDFHL
jgi:hypothetical protein